MTYIPPCGRPGSSTVISSCRRASPTCRLRPTSFYDIKDAKFCTALPGLCIKTLLSGTGSVNTHHALLSLVSWKDGTLIFGLVTQQSLLAWSWITWMFSLCLSWPWLESTSRNAFYCVCFLPLCFGNKKKCGVFFNSFLKNILSSETKHKNFAIWKDKSPGAQLSPGTVNALT